MKPQPKKTVAVRHAFKLTGLIEFVSDKATAIEFKQFGAFLDEDTHRDNEFVLLVDPQYDFDEVLNYIENYDKNITDKISLEISQMLNEIDLKF
jgi:hypothetical protein